MIPNTATTDPGDSAFILRLAHSNALPHNVPSRAPSAARQHLSVTQCYVPERSRAEHSHTEHTSPAHMLCKPAMSPEPALTPQHPHPGVLLREKAATRKGRGALPAPPTR